MFKIVHYGKKGKNRRLSPIVLWCVVVDCSDIVVVFAIFIIFRFFVCPDCWTSPSNQETAGMFLATSSASKRLSYSTVCMGGATKLSNQNCPSQSF
eukprot:s1252_g5.t1